jgi:hypothetical protein
MPVLRSSIYIHFALGLYVFSFGLQSFTISSLVFLNLRKTDFKEIKVKV